jgi:hypothetical protein
MTAVHRRAGVARMTRIADLAEALGASSGAGTSSAGAPRPAMPINPAEMRKPIAAVANAGHMPSIAVRSTR